MVVNRQFVYLKLGYLYISFVNSRSEKTKCKHMDDCTEDAFCNGRNATCPNPDPKPDNVTECNQGTQVCSTDKSQLNPIPTSQGLNQPL